ncbi:hypothetical protein DER46DRAFT_14880 [Fusarium sp. MPI-SDFR-AT-0072]|nr:hypothetical protein DER46DRAFT_14880 [Fusarium sp. MPI-SDFR-AT-0072]
MITQSMHANHIHIAALTQTPYPPHVLLFMLSILSSQQEAQFPILVLLFFFPLFSVLDSLLFNSLIDKRPKLCFLQLQLGRFITNT